MKKLFPLTLIAASLIVAGCNSNSEDKATTPEPTLKNEAMTLQLLHFADIDGTAGAINYVSNFSALLDKFRDGSPENTLVVSSGDNLIPGPRYLAGADDSMKKVFGVNIPAGGRADIALMNFMGVQASAVGNHDLDDGLKNFVNTISPEAPDAEDNTFFSFPGASFPYLSTNLDFTTDKATASLVVEDGQDIAKIAGKLAGYGIVDVNGQKIGLVGAVTPTLSTITKTGDITELTKADTTVAIAASIQPSIDALKAKGINKIIVLAHMQLISVEKELATLLDGVDIIVAGGSNTIFADSDDVLRSEDEQLKADGKTEDYPLHFQSTTGEPVLVVNTDGDYKYLGRLIVKFDEDGIIQTEELKKAEIKAKNGAYASTDAIVSSLEATPISAVEYLADNVKKVLTIKDGNTIGFTSVYMDGRRSSVRNFETNFGNITADANLWYAKKFDSTVQVSIKNGGGIRDKVGIEFVAPGTNDAPVLLPPRAATLPNGTIKPAGAISQLAIEGALRFNNSLTLLDISREELKRILEHGVSKAGETSGRFSQVAGLTFTYDIAGAAQAIDEATGDATTVGTRVQTVTLDDGTKIVENGTVVAGSAIRVVTLGFLAGQSGEKKVGGDGYPWTYPQTNVIQLKKAAAEATGLGLSDFSAYGREQDALAEYLKAEFTTSDRFDMPVDGEGRITKTDSSK